MLALGLDAGVTVVASELIIDEDDTQSRGSGSEDGMSWLNDQPSNLSGLRRPHSHDGDRGAHAGGVV